MINAIKMRLEQLKREKYKPTEKSVSKIFILKKSGDCKEDIIYALIYDEFDFNKPKKKVISAHKARKTAEKALAKRQRKLGKKVWGCYTRIVWVDGRIRAGDYITPDLFSTWAPGEEIPEGDRIPDGD